MNFGSVKSLSILGKAVKTLFFNGKKVWSKAAPYVPVPNSYIETDGVGSYMDLGFIPTESTAYEIEYVLFPRDGKTVGYMMGASEGRYIQFAIGSGNASTYNVTRPTMSFQPSASSERHVLKYDGSKIVFDGEDNAITYPPYAARSVTMRLGDDGRSLFANCRIYVAKYWENGVLIRNLVPYTGERGVGLLDLVHDVLYTNAGTGTMTYGIDKPYDYELDWVQTDGAASYFDLGFVPDPTVIRYELDFTLVGYNYVGQTGNFRNVIFSASGGLTTALNRSGCCVRYTASRGQYVQFYYPTSSDASIQFGKNERVSVIADVANQFIEVNGNRVSTSAVTALATDTMKLGTGYVGDPNCYTKTTFYSARFYESGIVVRDLIPVMKDGVPGLWDKVEGKFYGNAGGGTITAGPRADGEPFVMTKEEDDSNWSALLTDITGYNPPSERTENTEFSYSADFVIVSPEPSDETNSVYGFMYNGTLRQMDVFDPKNSTRIVAVVAGVVTSSSASSNLTVTTGERHFAKFGWNPALGTGRNFVTIDNETSFGSWSSTGTTMKTNPIAAAYLYFGRRAGHAAQNVSVKVYGMKVTQGGNLIADLVPYRDGDEIGLMNRLDGKKFPGSNLVYGKD